VTPTNVPKRFTTQMYIYFLPTSSTTPLHDKANSDKSNPEDGEGFEPEVAIPTPTTDWNIPLLVSYPHQHGYAWHRKAASSSFRLSFSYCTRPLSISTISAHPPRTAVSPEITYPARSSRQGESDWSTSSSLEIHHGPRSASVPCHRLQGSGGREKTAEACSGLKDLDQSSKPRMQVGEATTKIAYWWTSRRKVRDELRSSAEKRP
jgi:hypothetical protein